MLLRAALLNQYCFEMTRPTQTIPYARMLQNTALVVTIVGCEMRRGGANGMALVALADDDEGVLPERRRAPWGCRTCTASADPYARRGVGGARCSERTQLNH